MNKKKPRKIITFEPEDGAVLEMLKFAKRCGRGEISRMINEAIRYRGDAALLAVLKRDVIAAEQKFRDTQSEILERRKTVNPKSGSES